MMPHLVVVGNPACRRVGFWRAAAERLRWPSPAIVPYADLLRGRVELAEYLQAGAIVRFESAAESWETFKLLLAHGYDAARQTGYPALAPDDAMRLRHERGWLVRPRQAFLGFVRLLHTLENEARATGASLLHSAPEIARCFDKADCQLHLGESGVPIPTPLGSPRHYDDLRSWLAGEARVMVKLAHGSGAAGCIAVHASRGRVRALTTVAEVVVDGEPRLYHSKKLRYLRDELELARLVDRLGPEKLHAEEWLPKARHDGANFDLRIVTIAGEPRHRLARLSQSVFTNLTLGGRRDAVTAIAQRMSEHAWETLLESCRQAARAFPESFTLGLDVLVRPDWKRHAVLEANAFGDLLLHQLDRGHDTYTATLSAWQAQRQPIAAASATP